MTILTSSSRIETDVNDIGLVIQIKTSSTTLSSDKRPPVKALWESKQIGTDGP